MGLLGVNIDHIATVREVRGTLYPDPISAAKLAELGGADAIVCHLREDRRHIQDHDVITLRKSIDTKLTLEMATTGEMLNFAQRVKPDTACFVPEKREELTTEGGLDIKNNFKHIQDAVARLKDVGIRVSLFIEPTPEHIALAKEAGAAVIEIHTGAYCETVHNAWREKSTAKIEMELQKIIEAAQYAVSLNLQVNAGHGIDYSNIIDLVKGFKKNNITITEYNIGHSIIAKSLFVGLKKAVSDMKKLI